MKQFSMLPPCMHMSVSKSQTIPSHFLIPLVTINCSSKICESVSILYTSLFVSLFFLDSTCKQYMVFAFLCLLTLVSMIISRSNYVAASAVAKSLQSCPTLCDPINGSPPGSAVPEILQARTLEWVAISFSNAWKWKVKVKSLSRVRPMALFHSF